MMLLSAVVLTVGCSEDDAGASRRDVVTVELAPYASGYTEKEPVNIGTRGDEPSSPVWAPDKYFFYEDLESASGIYISNVNSAIGAFFTYGTTRIVRKFQYERARDKWQINEPLDEAEQSNDNNYYLYGIVPYNAANVNIAPLNGNYLNGAVMTMDGLTSVMNQDPCIVVGAKHGSKNSENDDPVPAVSPMNLGDFYCFFKVSSSVEQNQNNPNYLFLLFDHLYAALRFRFRVDAKYAELRSIRLKKLEMRAYQDQACTLPVQENVRTTVTLEANNTGASPIVGSIEFTQEGGPMENFALIYENSEGNLIPTGNEYTDNLGFVPKIKSYFKLRSTYDVYDTNKTVENDNKGNLIRKDCVAENKIDPMQLFQTESLDRGNLYTLNLTIKPTYLYVLSEPDLDSPTVTVE